MALLCATLGLIAPRAAWSQACGYLPATYPVTAGSSGPLNIGSGTEVNGNDVSGSGTSIQMNAVRTSATPSFPALSPVSYPSFSSNTTTSAATVAAGTYNTVTVGGTTTFSGGTYYINTLTATAANATLKFGTGTYYITTANLSGTNLALKTTGVVTIYLGSNLTTGTNSTVNSGAAVANLRLFLYPNANVSLGTSSTFGGVIYGTGGGNNVNLAASVQLQGLIAVNSNVSFSSNEQINLTAANQTAIAAISTCPAAPAPLAQWHLDEGSWSGATGEVADSSGNGYNGTAVNGATTGSATPALAGTPGTCNYGSFDASKTYLRLASTLPHMGNNFTVTAWIRATSAGYGRIFWDDYNYNGYALSFADPGGTRVRFYTRLPSTVTTDSQLSLNLNQWYFVAAVMDATTNQTTSLLIFDSNGNLVDSQSSARTAFTPSNGAYATIGGNADGSSEGSQFRFPGFIDEVTLYNSTLSTAQLTGAVLATHTCSTSVPDHYAVTAPASAVNCDPAAVTIAAHTSAHAAIATGDTIALSTSTGHGDWTLTTGGGTFVAGASNSGTATYKYATADNGSVTLALRDTAAETVTVNVTDGSVTARSGTALAAEDGATTFAAAGFRITNGANSPVAIATQIAAKTSTMSLALQAVRTDTNTGACTSVIASGATANISLAFQCNNPGSCVGGQTFAVTNNGTTTAVAANGAAAIVSYTTVALKFSTANAEAPFTLNYTDVGQVTLAARYTLPLGNAAASSSTIFGTSQFVVQPYSFALASLKRSSDAFANPAASTAGGTVFIGAGQPFTATVTAQNYAGAAAPNFGQELSAATVTLTSNLILPAGGDNPVLAGNFGAFTSGVAAGSGFSWPEVGIISLTPGTSNYLGTGNVSGATSGNVGRFIPNSFATAVNAPLFATACSSGAFTYIGQPFTYTTPPVITVTAQALGGATTKNYTGPLFRLTNASLTGRSYTATPASPALTLTGLPATTTDPAIADLGTGVATLTFGAGSGLAFTRSGAIPPFSANIALTQNVIDLDAVAADNPVSFGAGSGIPFNFGASQFYGRLALRNALGSELLDLPMSLTTQYYLSGAAGFTANTADNCSVAPSIAFSAYQLNLNVGETCVRDSGSPGVSGAGCASAAPGALAFQAKAAAGGFNLVLQGPGSGNNGAVTVTATTPAWLQYLWNTGSGTNSNPTGLATFGVFQGPASRIYQREVY